jgi:3-methyladenine DNA glycosylase AlkD
MTVAEVHALLEKHRDERGIAHWNKRFGASKMRSLGIGLTVLRKLAKQVGRDHVLARALWTDELYEARVMSLLIDDPKKISRDQAETQVEQLFGGQLAHVFSSCDAALAKVPYARTLAEDWMVSADPVRRSCGYALLYELSKLKTAAAPDDAYFAAWIQQIDATRHDADVDVLMGMATALMGIGKRSAALNRKALPVAQAIGPIDWDQTGACEPFDVVKHIDNPRLRTLLGITGG